MPIVLDGIAGITAPAIDAALDANDLTGRVPAANVNLGGVLQVVSTPKRNIFSTQSTTFVNVTGLSASITPSSASSKILITAMVTLGVSRASGSSGAFIDIAGGGVDFVGDVGGARNRATYFMRNAADLDVQEITQAVTVVFLDSPNTTASTTYQVRLRTSNATARINANGIDFDTPSSARTVSSITLMEIAA